MTAQTDRRAPLHFIHDVRSRFAHNTVVVGVRLAVPFSRIVRDRTKRVRQAVPLQPGPG